MLIFEKWEINLTSFFILVNIGMRLIVSIPNTKQSERFPGKNKLLAEHTIQWLNEELKTLPKEWEVEVVEITSPWTDETITPYQKFNSGYEDDHQKSLEALQKAFKADLHVHLQVTQPKRRVGLLKDAVNTLLTTNASVVSSYVTWKNDYSWREIVKTPKGHMFCHDKRNNDWKHFYDGAIYVAKDLSKLWDYDAKWDFVWNGHNPVVDVDYPHDLNNFQYKK